MERWIVKLISLLSIFSVTVIATLLPLKLRDYFQKWGKTGQHIISSMMCFGGGVFFAIYILHMAPDVQGLVAEMICEPYGINYPLAELLISLGFFLMVFSEKLILRIMRPDMDDPNKYVLAAINSNDDIIGKKLSGNFDSGKEKSLSLELVNGSSSDYVPQEDKEDLHEEEPTIAIEHSAHGHSHDIGTNLTGTRSFLLLMALSLHHIFEGISVGLKTSVTSVWNLTIAILLHEVVISFSLGLQLVKAYKNASKVILAALICTSMVPIGIAIGMLITETGQSSSSSMDIINGILQSLATGVFIYVTFFEILMEELSQSDMSMQKIFWMFLGYLTMALLALFPEDANENAAPSNCTLICV